jgi:hypothetical protein
MVAVNPNNLPSDTYKPVPHVNRVRYYFDLPSGLAREKFLHIATGRQPPSAKDIRLHAWLAERMAILHHERHGLWPKLRRFLIGNRLVRWLRLQVQRIGDG